MYQWSNGTPLHNSYYNNKIKGNLIHTTVCFLGLHQHNDAVPHSSVLESIFSNIKDLNISISNCSTINPDSYHPPVLLDCKLTLDYPHISLTPHNYAQGNIFCFMVFYPISRVY
jgi:hypothetical protein